MGVCRAVLWLGGMAAVWALWAGGAGADTLGSPAAPLPKDGVNYHPDKGDMPKFNLVTFEVPGGQTAEEARTAVLEGRGYSQMGEMETPFHNTDSTIAGTFWSEAWRADEGHMLFLYRMANSGTEHLQQGHVGNYQEKFNVTDCGVLRPVAGSTFLHGDLLLWQWWEGLDYVEFYFRLGGIGNEPIIPGETSAWMYLETDAPDFTVGYASIMDGGSVEEVQMYSPVPEPGAMALLLLAGAAGMVLRRRRRRKR